MQLSRLPGPDGARNTFGFDEARPIAELGKALPQLLADQPGIYTFVGADPHWDRTVSEALNGVRALSKRRSRGVATTGVHRRSICSLPLRRSPLTRSSGTATAISS